jgi:hypothetical protein
MATPYRLCRPPYATDQNGRAIAGATVTFYVQATGALATIYLDEALTLPITGSAVTTDSDGMFAGYYISDDDYPLNTSFKLVVAKANYETRTEQWVR